MQRTDQQNRALHKFFEQVADELNAAGYSVQEVLTKHTSIDIPWNKESVKDILWRTVQVRLLGKRSTTELSKQQDIDAVYDVVNRFLGERLHIHVPFPSMPPGHADTAPMFSERQP